MSDFKDYKMKELLVVSLLFLSVNSVYASKRISCKHSENQVEAQRYFDAKKRGWKSLDRDKDGEPC